MTVAVRTMDFGWSAAGSGVGAASSSAIRLTSSAVAPFGATETRTALISGCPTACSDRREIEGSGHLSHSEWCVLLHNRSDVANVVEGEFVASVRHCCRQRRECSDSDGNE